MAQKKRNVAAGKRAGEWCELDNVFSMTLLRHGQGLYPALLAGQACLKPVSMGAPSMPSIIY
jgi:hypothetical protein